METQKNEKIICFLCFILGIIGLIVLCNFIDQANNQVITVALFFLSLILLLYPFVVLLVNLVNLKDMKKLEEILIQAKKDFPQEFEKIIPCDKSKDHDWFINLSNKEGDVRLINIECRHCKTNLAIALRLFIGIQDHG